MLHRVGSSWYWFVCLDFGRFRSILTPCDVQCALAIRNNAHLMRRIGAYVMSVASPIIHAVIWVVESTLLILLHYKISIC